MKGLTFAMKAFLPRLPEWYSDNHAIWPPVTLLLTPSSAISTLVLDNSVMKAWAASVDDTAGEKEGKR